MIIALLVLVLVAQLAILACLAAIYRRVTATAAVLSKLTQHAVGAALLGKVQGSGAPLLNEKISGGMARLRDKQAKRAQPAPAEGANA